MTRLFAVDPGTRRIGLASMLLHPDGPPELVAAVALDVAGWTLADIAGAVAAERMRAGCGHAAIETPGPWMRGAKAGRSFEAVTKLYEVIGAIRATLERCCVGVAVVPDTTVKLALAGRENGSKAEVHRSLGWIGYRLPQLRRQTCPDCRAVGIADDHSPDAADAVALAHVAAERIRLGLP